MGVTYPAPTILSDEILTASYFAELMTGYYFTQCDTFRETQNHLAANHVFIQNGWKLSEINKIPPSATCVFVQFSKEDCYTEYETLIIRVNKKYLNKFTKRLQEE